MILSRQDLADEENLRRCRHEFVKAFDTLGRDRPFKLAEWALDWGEAALHEMESGRSNLDAVELADKEAAQAEKESDELRIAIEASIKQIELICDALGRQSASAALFNVIGKLEAAL